MGGGRGVGVGVGVITELVEVVMEVGVGVGVGVVVSALDELGVIVALGDSVVLPNTREETEQNAHS